jgi:hypothetical protein
MSLRHPFQKLCCVPATDQHGSLLLAASGSTVFVSQLDTGRVSSRWSTLEGSISLSPEDDSVPNKRRKIENHANGGLGRQDSDESVEIRVERRKGERRKPKVEQPKSSNVSHLLVTKDGQTLVAATAEDKAIQVFGFANKAGDLVLKSSRCAYNTQDIRNKAYRR